VSLELKDLLPLVTPAVAAGGIWVQGLLQARDDRYRGKLARDEAVEMIELLEKWMKTQEMACSPEEFQQVKRVARQRLDDMYLALEGVHEKSQPQHTETRPPLQRLFLLYPPAGFSGWMAAAIFYALIILGGMFSIGVLLTFKSSDIGPSIAFFVVLGIMFLPVHAWARHADAKGRQQNRAGGLPKVA
jgi:hypothetical protein